MIFAVTTLLGPAALAADPARLRAGLEAPEGWEELERKQVKDVGEVLVRHKVIDGENCLEGSATAALDADRLLQLASDIPNQPSWSSWEVPVSRILSGGGSAFEYVQLLDNPAPVADRYWIVRATSGRRGEDRVFTWDQVDPARFPEVVAEIQAKYEGAIATRVNVGDWTFTPTGSATRIRYRICTDAGGSLPRWIGEYAARTTLPGNIADLVRRARR